MKRFVIIAGIIMLAAAARLLILTGLSNNTLFASGIAAVLLGYGTFFDRLIKNKWINMFLIVSAGFFTILIIYLAAYGHNDTATYDEDIAIVLGGGLRGETVSRILAARLDKALEYYRRNPDALIVVTGGQGPDEAVTEAEAMARYLMEHGVNGEKILLENEALSTYENMVYTKELLDKNYNGYGKAVVITNAFHMYRSLAFARMAGIDCTRLHADSAWYTLPINYTRECAAVIKLWLLKK